MDRPVRRVSFKAESDMPADYTCATAVVPCVDHGPLTSVARCRRDARVINLPFWSTLMFEFDAL